MQTHFLQQAAACADLGSPLTARVLRLLAPRIIPAPAPGSPVIQRLLAWPATRAPKADAVALRQVGGLHALVRAGRDAPRAALYARPEGFTDPQAEAALQAALARHTAALLPWLDQAPQTNEARRAVALIAAARWLCARMPLPLLLSELGASAGLNLIWDHYRLEAGTGHGPAASPVVLAPAWRGPALPPAAPLARLAMAADGEGDGAGLTLQIWPGGALHRLARVDFHGRWIDWRAPLSPQGAIG